MMRGEIRSFLLLVSVLLAVVVILTSASFEMSPVYTSGKSYDLEIVHYENKDNGYRVKGYLFKPVNLDKMDSVDGVVLTRGGEQVDNCEEKLVEFGPLAKELADKGYLVFYPCSRFISKQLGASDTYYGIQYGYEREDLKLGEVACVGFSMGNRPTFELVTGERYQGVCDSYVDMYGVGPEEPFIVDNLNVPTLIQVGGNDNPLIIGYTYGLNNRLDAEKPELPHELVEFPGASHTFFWNLESENSMTAHENLYEFLDWSIREGDQPMWFDDGNSRVE